MDTEQTSGNIFRYKYYGVFYVVDIAKRYIILRYILVNYVYHYLSRKVSIGKFFKLRVTWKLIFWQYCVKSVRIQSFSGPYFPTFGLNTDCCSVYLRIYSEYWKRRIRKNPYTDTIHAVQFTVLLCKSYYPHVK